jgi:hypothetical protein
MFRSTIAARPGGADALDHADAELLAAVFAEQAARERWGAVGRPYWENRR